MDNTAAVPWIVFGGVIVTLLAGNGVFAKVMERRGSRAREGRHERHLPTLLAAIGLTLSLLCVLLIPVDVFSVSADTANQAFWLWCVRLAYYGLYSAQLFMVFLLLPFVYFFFEEFGERTSIRQRLFGATMYTVLMFVVFTLIMVVGLLLFYFKKPTDTPDSYQDVVNAILNKNVAEAALLFFVALASSAGYIVFLTYTAYGMSALPLYILFGRGGRKIGGGLSGADEDVDDEVGPKPPKRGRRSGRSYFREVEDESDGGDLLRDEDRVDGGGSGTEKKRDRYSRRQRKGFRAGKERFDWRKLLDRLVLPLRLVLAALVALFGLLMIVSIVLASISRLVDSAICGATCGYLLNHPSMFNLLDKLLVILSDFFPADYILLGSIVTYFHLCTIFGVIDLGVRVLCMSLYVVRPWRTKPQAMLILSVISMLSLVAMVCVVLQIAPQYATYGAQTYGDGTSCDFTAPLDECQMTILASSLNWITLKLSLFGMFFYYANFVFLVCAGLGLALALSKRFLCAGEEGCFAWLFGLNVDEDSDEDF